MCRVSPDGTQFYLSPCFNTPNTKIFPFTLLCCLQARIAIWPQFGMRETAAADTVQPPPAQKKRRRVTVSAAEPEVVDIVSLASDDPQAAAPAAVAPSSPAQDASARRPRPRRPPPVVPVQVAIDADGQAQTEVIPLDGRATLSMGSDVGLVAGGTTHYRHPTLRVPATVEHGPFCCRLALPIRARHTRLGEGYLGLVAHMPRQRKSKPVFLSFLAAVTGVSYLLNLHNLGHKATP